MLVHRHLNAPLIRSFTAELARRGTVHHSAAGEFVTADGTVQAVRWEVSLADSDDDYGTQLLHTLLVDVADHHDPSEPVTTTVIPQQLRPHGPMMLIMDVDSTLIDQEVIDVLAGHAGRADEVAAVTERAMRGELDFTESLYARVKALSGLPLSVLSETLDQITPTIGAAELIGSFRAEGYPVYAVSGGFLQILAPLAETLGLTGFDANDLEHRQGRLTGAVQGTVVDRKIKRDRLQHWASEAGVAAHNVVAVGDGANDLDMVNAAGIGVAFCAKPALAEQADLVIKHRNLELISWALGMPRRPGS